MQNPQTDFISTPQESGQENDFLKRIGEQFLILWPWIILSVAVCVILSYINLRYQTPEYRVKASVLIQDDKNTGSSSSAGVLEEFGLLAGKRNVDNEVEIFKSFTLMKAVVEAEQLFIKYYYPTKFRDTEVFTKRPVSMKYVDPRSDTSHNFGRYNLVLNPKQADAFTITVNEKNYPGKFGDTLNVPGGRIVIYAAEGLRRWNYQEPVIIVAAPLERAVTEYMSRLSVAIPNKQVSIIVLSLNEVIPEKGERVLNALIRTYLQANVNDNNQIADSTIKFIDDRLKLVFGELSGIEKEIENFKIENKLTDISEQARVILENTTAFAKQQAEQEVQLAVIDSLEQFLANTKNNSRVVPSSLVMQEPSFISLIQRYNEVQLARDKMLMSATNAHPSIGTIDEQLTNIRKELLSSIGSIKKGVIITINELRKRTARFDAQITSVPQKERVWLDYSRQQAIKQELYLFLLKKREETAISKSSTLANGRIVDSAKAEANPFKPQKRSFIMFGFILGIALPFVFYFIKGLFNTRVSTSKDILAATITPILAEIGHSADDGEVVVTANAKSHISEQFRSLRTNVKFLLTGEQDKVLLITSSMGGEGKSFLSINLAASLAIAGKKVILMELDLRKPKISEILKLQKIGITNYLIEDGTDWKARVQVYGENTKFDVLSSGPIPPNPAELLMLPRMNDLVTTLRKHYDYIIIDSAPVGLVTDAQILASLADATIYVVRHRLTYKQQLRWLDKLYRKNSLPKMNIVVNDVQVKKVGYGYQESGYGYGYGFYEEKK